MKGRLAPTPSGRMHLGNLFAALLCWLSARAAGGSLIMRIEDLDTLRTSPAHTEEILSDLHWLGLDWDEGPGALSGDEGTGGPYLQSERTSFYEAQQAKLSALGLVYPCWCSRAELHAASAPHLGDGSYVYSGRCRDNPGWAEAAAGGRPPALRARVPDEVISFVDGCQGPFSQNLALDCGDFILRRSDGVFAYQLAATADDGAMGVTQVVRGRDLLASTPRQIWLLRTLGRPVPEYYHLPLLLAPDGRRLAKRDKDLDAGALRARLHGPGPLLGLLGHLAGLLEKPEPATVRDLLALFDWAKVPKEDIIIGEREMGSLLNISRYYSD